MFVPLFFCSLFISTLSSPIPSDDSNPFIEIFTPNVDQKTVLIVEDAPEIPYSELNSPTHGYSVMISGKTSIADMLCIRNKGYHSVFVNGLLPYGDAAFDQEAANSIKNAYQANLGSEIFIEPVAITSRYSGAQQVDILVDNLQNNGIGIKSIWILVTNPSIWDSYSDNNIKLISDMIRRAHTLGLTVGIYTNFYDWQQITDNWKNVGDDVLLWYWHVLGDGPSGESDTTFEDFRPFAGWYKPSVKQFARMEKVCGLTVHRNVYGKSVRPVLKVEESHRLFVGSIGI